MAMSGGLTESHPFGTVSKRCPLISGTGCMFECICPTRNCSYIGLHVTEDILKTSVGKLCEVFFINHLGIEPSLAAEIDKIATKGGTELDQFLSALLPNQTMPFTIVQNLQKLATASASQIVSSSSQTVSGSQIQDETQYLNKV